MEVLLQPGCFGKCAQGSLATAKGLREGSPMLALPRPGCCGKVHLWWLCCSQEVVGRFAFGGSATAKFLQPACCVGRFASDGFATPMFLWEGVLMEVLFQPGCSVKVRTWWLCYKRMLCEGVPVVVLLQPGCPAKVCLWWPCCSQDTQRRCAYGGSARARVLWERALTLALLRPRRSVKLGLTWPCYIKVCAGRSAYGDFCYSQGAVGRCAYGGSAAAGMLWEGVLLVVLLLPGRCGNVCL